MLTTDIVTAHVAQGTMPNPLPSEQDFYESFRPAPGVAKAVVRAFRTFATAFHRGSSSDAGRQSQLDSSGLRA